MDQALDCIVVHRAIRVGNEFRNDRDPVIGVSANVTDKRHSQVEAVMQVTESGIAEKSKKPLVTPTPVHRQQRISSFVPRVAEGFAVFNGFLQISEQRLDLRVVSFVVQV